jgi:hypothetical protein
VRGQITVSVFAIAIFATACGPADSDFNEFSTYKSPDGQYFVIVDSARSALAFGPETIRVYVVEKEKRVRNHIVTTKIANDGGGISNANVKVTWIQSDTIKFCLTGVEQEDSVLEINLRTFSHTETKKNCS